MSLQPDFLIKVVTEAKELSLWTQGAGSVVTVELHVANDKINTSMGGCQRREGMGATQGVCPGTYSMSPTALTWTAVFAAFFF